jgi:hypothetical protein
MLCTTKINLDCVVRCLYLRKREKTGCGGGSTNRNISLYSIRRCHKRLGASNCSSSMPEQSSYIITHDMLPSAVVLGMTLDVFSSSCCLKPSPSSIAVHYLNCAQSIDCLCSVRDVILGTFDFCQHRTTMSSFLDRMNYKGEK